MSMDLSPEIFDCPFKKALQKGRERVRKMDDLYTAAQATCEHAGFSSMFSGITANESLHVRSLLCQDDQPNRLMQQLASKPSAAYNDLIRQMPDFPGQIPDRSAVVRLPSDIVDWIDPGMDALTVEQPEGLLTDDGELVYLFAMGKARHSINQGQVELRHFSQEILRQPQWREQLIAH